MKKAGIVTTSIGALIIIATIVWMTIGISILTKLPTGIDTTIYLEGEVITYVNPATQEVLPEGEGIRIPLSIERRLSSVDEEYSSDTAVIRDEVSMSFGPQELNLDTVYVMDRKNVLNKDDDRAYDWIPSNMVDRTGAYTVAVPMGASFDEVYPVWKAEVAKIVDAKFTEKVEREGVSLYDLSIPVADEPVSPVFIELLGFPSEISFDQLKGQMSALGVDLDALLGMAMQIMTPEDQQAVLQASQEPIQILYYWTGTQDAGIEPKTGSVAIVISSDEYVSMAPDFSALTPLFQVLMKYASDPNLGPALQQLAQLQAQMADVKPQKIFAYTYTQTEDSVKDVLADLKSNINKLNFAKVYIPIIGFVLGGLLVALGAFLLLRKRIPKK